jgi:hypothetical protein
VARWIIWSSCCECCERRLLELAEVHRAQHRVRVAVREDRFPRAHRQLEAARQARGVHRHHRRRDVRERVDSRTQLGVHHLLRHQTLLAHAAAPESAGHDVPREGDDRAILHQVGVFDRLDADVLVGDENQRLDHLAVDRLDRFVVGIRVAEDFDDNFALLGRVRLAHQPEDDESAESPVKSTV